MEKNKNMYEKIKKGAKIAPGKHKNFAVRETDSSAKRPNTPKSATPKDKN